MRRVSVLKGEFEETLPHADMSSFFYLDLPYNLLSSTANFDTYARGGFDDGAKKRVKWFCDRLGGKNCKWTLSSSDVMGADSDNTFFDDLYSEYRISRVWAKWRINSNPSRRGKLTELRITNYDIS